MNPKRLVVGKASDVGDNALSFPCNSITQIVLCHLAVVNSFDSLPTLLFSLRM